MKQPKQIIKTNKVKNKMKNIILFVFILLTQNLFAQNPEWINYTSGNSITSTAFEGDYIWVGTEGGLVKVNNTTGETVFYNKIISGLPDNMVNTIAIDAVGNKWIGTNGGLAKFDGINWFVYNASNSGLPGNRVNSVVIDSNGNKWNGTIGGLAKFDDTNWTVYNTSNSDLPDNDINTITIDTYGNKWIGTWGGLAVFNEGGVILSAEKNKENIPASFILSQNYPNPFNPTTTISYTLPLDEKRETKDIKLIVFDVLGKEVATLVNKQQPIGNYKVTFNASKLPSGIYFYRLQSGNFVETKKLVLIK